MSVSSILQLAHWATAVLAIYTICAVLIELRVPVTIWLLWALWIGCFTLGLLSVRLLLCIPRLRQNYLNLPEHIQPFHSSRLPWSEWLVIHLIMGVVFHACTLVPGLVGGR